MNEEQVSVLLAGRACAYRALQTVLGNEPSPEVLGAWSGEAAQDALALYRASAPARYAELAEGLASVCADVDEAAVEDLRREYTELFIGPASLAAPPWESVYVAGEPLLFQPVTLEVRRAYLDEDLVPTEYPHVADDHVSLELDFMAALAARMLQAWGEGDAAEARRLAESQIAFLDKHLLVWIEPYCEALRGAGEYRFYPQVVELAQLAMRADRALLGEVRDELAVPPA